MKEKDLQSEIIKWLRAQGAYVMKMRPGPGIPVGCPDVIFLFEGAWGAIEVKSGKTSKYQPGQESTLQRLRRWSPFIWKAYPENWPEIKKQLSSRFF